MRSLSVVLASIALLCSTAALFSGITWGEPIGVDSFGPAPVRGKAAIQEEVRAKKFVLVNEQGTRMGTFGPFNDQPGLVLHDQDNKVRAVLALDKNGEPGLVLYDENQKPRAQVIMRRGEPKLVLFGENRKPTFRAPQESETS